MDVDQPDADRVEPGTGAGDSVDARSMGSIGSFGRTAPAPPRPAPTSVKEGIDPLERYNMNYPRRGLAIIINNKTFDPRTGMNERTGTDADAANLYTQFKALGFEVHRFQNKTTTEMLQVMNDAAKYNHEDCDCFAMAILSHGDEGIVYGTDGITMVETLVAPVKGAACPSLVGKPKLCFIQACRGSKLDHGVEVSDADHPGIINRIPTEADVLMCFSTVPGYFSWRNSTKGSWFIQALCRMLDRYGGTRDLLWIMTRVNYAVAYEFESNASREYMNRKKQIPCIMSMLTKDLYLTAK
jgi:hypothetical protein